MDINNIESLLPSKEDNGVGGYMVKVDGKVFEKVFPFWQYNTNRRRLRKRKNPEYKG